MGYKWGTLRIIGSHIFLCLWAPGRHQPHHLFPLTFSAQDQPSNCFPPSFFSPGPPHLCLSFLPTAPSPGPCWGAAWGHQPQLAPLTCYAGRRHHCCSCWPRKGGVGVQWDFTTLAGPRGDKVWPGLAGEGSWWEAEGSWRQACSG